MPYSIYLKKGEDKHIRSGRSWVYANEVARIEGKDKNGALANVYDSDGNFLGKGYINHLSKILVRIFLREPDAEDDENLYISRLSAAAEYRKKLGFDNSCRLVFAEADDLPALIVDKYDDILVLQCLSLGIEKRKDMIVRCLVKLFSPRGIYERSDAAVRRKEGLEEMCGVLYGEVPERVIIDENGVKMAVDVRNGQKTGYFLDQRDNRFAIRRYIHKGDSVLDCFCNSGGFSMNAALVGASVLAVDISEAALNSVRENATLNGFDNVRTEKADVFELLRRLKAESKNFDAVILDPPAFCKSANEVGNAFRGYRDINVLGMKLVKKGGFLMTSSCSSFMLPQMFEKMLSEAASISGRRARVAEIRTQAPDHPSPLAQEQTQYLKFYVLQIY